MADVETATTQAQESTTKNEAAEKKEETPAETVAKETVDAFNMLAQGKRNLLCGEVTDAVSQLQEASRLLASKYGDTAEECAEAYLCYGTALLELSRMESGVLGNALDGIDEEEDEEKSSSSDDKVEDPEKTSDSSDGKEDGDTEEEGTEPESEDIGDEEGETEGAEAGGSGEGEAEEGGSKEDQKKENEADDDVSNLQLSWEMLELAKLIYSRQTTKEMKLKAADAHLRLGEVGLETEQYEQAIEDFLSCLSIQKEHLEAESRLIAETHYQIGVACCHAGKYDESISNLKSAVTVIRAKIAQLEKFVKEEEAKKGKGKEPASFDDPLTKAHKEIKDLNEILPDILTKIEDTEDEQKSQDKVKQMVKENLASDMGTTTTTGFSGESSSAAAAPSSVNEIQPHLVRKKRKPEEESEEESKKPRQEENQKVETNGEKAQES